ncbi:MAG: ABC transporter substrate-binding protein [Gammaproteobacteria bacterium]
MRIVATACLVLGLLAAPAMADTRTPDEIVRQTADTLSARIEGRQQQLAANPAELYKLVDEVFLPVFDTDYAGRLVLGKHWRTATPVQRQQFIDTFYDFLLRSYSRYVLRFEKDRVRILPPPAGAPDPKRAVVRTEMQLEDGTKLPVHYSLHQTKDGWRAFDVRIEGISYVQNYRNQFNAEIGARGIDAVIARLKADAAKVTTSPPVAGGKT